MPKNLKTTISSEALLAFIFGIVALIVLFGVAIFADEQNDLLITIARVVLALACAGVAAMIPGFIDLHLAAGINSAIRAGGAIAVFVLVFFFNPPNLLQSQDRNDVVIDPSTEYLPVIQEWLSFIDNKEFEKAYSRAAPSTKSRYSFQTFKNVFEDFLESRGNVKHRSRLGTSSAVQLPSGDRGNFRIVTYESEFGNGEKRHEYIIVEAKEGEWFVKEHFFSQSSPL